MYFVLDIDLKDDRHKNRNKTCEDFCQWYIECREWTVYTEIDTYPFKCGA